MKNTKPTLEKITPKFGSSFYLRHNLATTIGSKSSFWHFHPEIELVYVKGGSGKRHVGHHLSYFHHGD